MKETDTGAAIWLVSVDSESDSDCVSSVGVIRDPENFERSSCNLTWWAVVEKKTLWGSP